MSTERTRDLFGFPIRKADASDEQVSVPKENSEVTNPFDTFMFGGTRKENSVKEKKKSSYSEILDQIDVDDVLHHVDNLIESAKGLKPLLGKVKPVLDQFLNKK